MQFALYFLQLVLVLIPEPPAERVCRDPDKVGLFSLLLTSPLIFFSTTHSRTLMSHMDTLWCVCVVVFCVDAALSGGKCHVSLENHLVVAEWVSVLVYFCTLTTHTHTLTHTLISLSLPQTHMAWLACGSGVQGSD